MEVMLVFGDAEMCDRIDMENLSWKKFADFDALDKYLESIRKGDGKFEVIGIDAFVEDWNDTDDDNDYIKSYRAGETYMAWVKIG